MLQELFTQTMGILAFHVALVKFCTRYGSGPVVLCVKFQNDLTNDKWRMGERYFVRFEFKGQQPQYEKCVYFLASSVNYIAETSVQSTHLLSYEQFAENINTFWHPFLNINMCWAVMCRKALNWAFIWHLLLYDERSWDGRWFGTCF